MDNLIRCGLLTISLVLGMTASSPAETIFKLDVKTGSSTSSATVYLSATGFRYETEHTASIFRADLGTLYDITPARRRYTRITPDKLRQAAAEFDKSRHDWGGKLNAMSDEQRRQMEAAFGPPAANSGSPLEFTTTEFTATFANWHCQMLHVMLEGVQHGAACVVPLAELDLNASDVQVLRRLTEFMQAGPRPTVGIASFWDLAAIEAAGGHPAFPVDTIIAEPNGWLEFTLRSVEKRSAPANAFDLPEGMSEEAMPPRPGG